MRDLRIFIKFGFIFVLIGMVIILCINYYLNFLETKELVEETEKEQNPSKLHYESMTLNPQYYSYDKENRKLFVQAEYANKNKGQINMDGLSGYMELSDKIKLEYNARRGKIYTDTKKVILSDGITVKGSNGGELVTKKLLIDYDRYQLSSDSEIRLLYKNIILTAANFSFNKDKLVNFSGFVKMKIKAK